ncbi:MAG TPA: ATPase domain-containing protein [Gemmatimonadaceae bacterium]
MSTTAMISTGINELDQRLGGLVPGRYYLLTGTPGAGKTSACLHFLTEGLRAGERCAILTQENPDDLFAQAEFVGYDLRDAVADESLVLLQYRLDFSDNYARAGNPRALVNEFMAVIGDDRPQRLVVDSIVPFIQAGGVIHGAVNSLIQMMEETQATAYFTVPGDLGDSFYARLYDPVVSGTAGILHFEMDHGDIRRISIRKIRQTPASTEPLQFVIRAGLGIVGLTPAPVAEAPATRTMAAAGTIGPAPSGGGNRVALVNSGGFLGGELYASLEHTYDLDTFASEAEALARVPVGYDCVLVAVDPVSADTTLSFVRTVRRSSGVPIVLLSEGEGLRGSTRTRALRAGADEFLVLGESGQGLLARIEAARARGHRDTLQRLRPERLLVQPRDDAGRPLVLPEEEILRAVKHHLKASAHPFFALVRLQVPADLLDVTWEVLCRGLRLDDGDLIARGTARNELVLYLHDISRRHARELLARVFAADPRLDAVEVQVDHYPADMPRLQPWLAEARGSEAVQAVG